MTIFESWENFEFCLRLRRNKVSEHGPLNLNANDVAVVAKVPKFLIGKVINNFRGELMTTHADPLEILLNKMVSRSLICSESLLLLGNPP